MAQFVMSNSGTSVQVNCFVLTHSSWNDWFKYETLYRLDYVDEDNSYTNIGTLKIAQESEMGRIPDLPDSFNKLDEKFFSLGQDSDYYKRLNTIGEELREEVLIALGDLALNKERFKELLYASVVQSSLLRDVSALQVQGEFNKLSLGHVELTKYSISYSAYTRSSKLNPPLRLEFDVDPNSEPPSNVHVIIGRNGVGKTHLLNNMINSLLQDGDGKLRYGQFSNKDNEDEILFTNLVSVNFSAFDDTLINKDRKGKVGQLGYSYIGLIRSDIPQGGIKSPTILKNEFVKAIEICSRGAKHRR